jgi:TatD DNase family protein
LIDFHCHLDLYPDAAQVAEDCLRRGIFVLSVTTTPSAWKGTRALVGSAGQIETALGLHPQIAHQRQSELPIFDELLPQVAYVGEIGLDGAPEFRQNWDSQVRVFEHILAACSEMGGRIMSLHSRRASRVVLDALEAFPDAGIPILHWFSGSFRDLDRAINLGCWFSVGPAMLQSKGGRSIAERLPRERVLTESDGPFARVQGKPLMPWQVDLAVLELSKIWSHPRNDVGEMLQNNLATLRSREPRLPTKCSGERVL